MTNKLDKRDWNELLDLVVRALKVIGEAISKIETLPVIYRTEETSNMLIDLEKGFTYYKLLKEKIEVNINE